MFCIRRIVVRGYGFVLGRNLLDSEIAILFDIFSNLGGKNDERQFLVGSFSGALSFSTGDNYKIISCAESVAPPRWFTPKKINKGDHTM